MRNYNVDLRQYVCRTVYVTIESNNTNSSDEATHKLICILNTKFYFQFSIFIRCGIHTHSIKFEVRWNSIESHFRNDIKMMTEFGRSSVQFSTISISTIPVFSFDSIALLLFIVSCNKYEAERKYAFRLYGCRGDCDFGNKNLFLQK